MLFCSSSDDQEDQETGKGDHPMEEQMGEQQPRPAAHGRGGEREA